MYHANSKPMLHAQQPLNNDMLEIGMSLADIVGYAGLATMWACLLESLNMFKITYVFKIQFQALLFCKGIVTH